jgi:hypothetical protein
VYSREAVRAIVLEISPRT